MKKSTLRKKGKQSISKIQRKLWQIIKQIIRRKYPNVCYTCGATGLTLSNFHTGHVPWPKGALGAYLRYDLRVLRPQCYNCNINRGGMGAEAYKRMLSEIGEEKMAQLERDRQVTVNAMEHYLKLLSEYEVILKSL